MVERGDMKIELVYADTKLPFIEHKKDEKIYVEVEPDVEYFISIKQTGTGRGNHTLLEISVDDQDLGYQYSPSLQRADIPGYQGVWNQVNGVCKCIPFQ
jgi:hypothetical protein